MGEGPFMLEKLDHHWLRAPLALTSLSTPDVAERALIQTLPDSAKSQSDQRKKLQQGAHEGVQGPRRVCDAVGDKAWACVHCWSFIQRVRFSIQTSGVSAQVLGENKRFLQAGESD